MLRGSVINKFSQLSPGSFIHSVGISNETSFSYPQTIHAEAEEGRRRAFASLRQPYVTSHALNS